jgi:hypothetical protein
LLFTDYSLHKLEKIVMGYDPSNDLDVETPLIISGQLPANV